MRQSDVAARAVVVFVRAVVVFARAPHLGKVKTRLAASVGVDEALRIYCELAEGVMRTLESASDCQVTVCCTPDHAIPEVRDWLGRNGIAVEGQGSGDLGARMAAALERQLAAGAQKVVVVGTDCPEMDSQIISDAFHALDVADVVFGPANDGGYYLVGAKRSVPALFRDVSWSTEHTLAESLRHAATNQYSVRLLAPLADIDTEADWRAWVARRARE